MLINNSSLGSHERLTIKKSTFEWIGLIFLLIFSFLNSITLLISLILLLTLLKQRQVGAIKIINLITFRTIINPGIAVGIENWQNLKWIILFGCSFYLLCSYFKLGKNELKRVNSIILLVILFTIYNIIVAFVFSSLPIVAIFKLLSYVVIFIGTLIGVGYTYKKVNWLNWMLKLLSLVFLPSIIFIILPVGYLRNGVSFQGIVNQPNMFGILAVLFIALVLSNAQMNKNINKLYLIVVPTLTVIMVILSKSRTALISCLILFLLYILLLNIKNISKIIVISFLSIGAFILVLGSNINEFFITYLYKGQEQGGILNSRVGQIESLTSNLLNNPWFGNGFAVPVLPYKSYGFSFEYIVEPGNLILSVLSYSGIFGFFIFLAYIIKIFWVNKREFKNIAFLPIAPILISMGEMVFFSSNNIGIWCYMFLAIYIFDNQMVKAGYN
ncbi:O-antigen ligase family protein [Cytobacillus sp. FJAT-54145]|uniref:O-antigen ligase family protein n=1 Tax=Cytobacillus spartinae TaxID=3299023 RepID=A0ABW6KC54_9BACI